MILAADDSSQNLSFVLVTRYDKDKRARKYLPE
jgi:hypothetical protein